jgi:hypothetical protein
MRHILTAGLLTLLGVLPGAALAATTPWAQTLTQQALDTGFLARLPPSVSVALGLAKPDEGTDVRQLLSKDGHRIRTFNVGVARHSDLVIFNVDAQNGETVAYLLSPEGQLLKAVSQKTGGEAKALAPADAKAGFARETHYWSARARKAPASAAATPPATPATPPKQ